MDSDDFDERYCVFFIGDQLWRVSRETSVYELPAGAMLVYREAPRAMRALMRWRPGLLCGRRFNTPLPNPSAE